MNWRISRFRSCLARLTLALTLCGAWSSPVWPAEDVEKVVRLGVPTGFKKVYPESNGIVWTDTLFKVIFERAGYRVDVFEAPAKRSPHLLGTGEIDSFLSANQSLGIYRDKLLPARYPGTSLAMYIYYDSRGDWVPSWPPDDVFKRKSGVSKQSQDSFEQDWNLNVLQTSSFDSCIKMVQAGRADYWIDNITGITNSTPGLSQIAEGKYAYRELFRIPIYMFFQPSDKGRQLKAIYDRGIEEILRNGEYLQIYYRYDNRFFNSREGEIAVQQIREMFPELHVPKQKPLNRGTAPG